MHDKNNPANDTCIFQAIYNDLEDEAKFKYWNCNEKREKSKMYCPFHDKTNNQWDDKTFARFVAKVKAHNYNYEKPLICIGYHFPANFSFNLLDRPLDLYKKKRIYNMLIYLCDAEFYGQVEFSYCIFKQPLNLSGAIFRGEVLFRDTIFKDRFYPRNTKFYGFYPRNTKFYDNVNFRYAKFENADFHDTLFKDKANFHDVTFTGNDTRFLDVKFRGKANFKNTKFYGKTEFRGTVFGEAEFSKDVMFKEFTKFWNVVFENVNFNTKNLKDVSFLNTDITHVKFADDVIWGEAEYDKIWGHKKVNEEKFKILDERLLERLLEEKKNRKKEEENRKREEEYPNIEENIESIKAIYRNLRENYEHRMRYDEAGQFFIREMELKRKYREKHSGNKYEIKSNNIFRRNLSLTGIYYRLFGYGEKLRNITFKTVLFFILSTLYWIFFTPLEHTTNNLEDMNLIGNATQRTLSDMFQIRSTDLIPADYFIRISSLVLLGILIIALKRKFERKVRH